MALMVVGLELPGVSFGEIWAFSKITDMHAC